MGFATSLFHTHLVCNLGCLETVNYSFNVNVLTGLSKGQSTATCCICSLKVPQTSEGLLAMINLQARVAPVFVLASAL